MKRCLFLAAIVLTAGFSQCCGAAEPVNLSDNAALYYWRAIAGTPWVRRYFEEHPAVSADPVNAPIDDQFSHDLQRHDSTFRYIRLATGCKQCEWAAVQDGPNTLLEHTQEMRNLCRLTVLRARVHFDNGQNREAIDDFRDLMVMARFVATDNTLMSSLSRVLYERQAIDVAARNLTQLEAAELKQLEGVLSDLPATASLIERIAAEKVMYLGWVRSQLQTDGAAAFERTLVSSALEAAEGDQKSASRKQSATEIADGLREAFAKGDNVIDEMIVQSEAQYDKIAALVDLPDREFEPAYRTFSKELASANPIARLHLELRIDNLKFDKLRARDRAAQTRIAMLRAGIDVVREGPAALIRHKDPSSDGSFAHRVLSNPKSFELTSEFLVDGRPLTLSFGPKSEP